MPLTSTRVMVLLVLLVGMFAGAGGCGGGESRPAGATRPATRPMVIMVGEPDITITMPSTRPAR